MAEKKGSSRAEKAVSNVKKKVDAPASSKSAGKKTAAGKSSKKKSTVKTEYDSLGIPANTLIAIVSLLLFILFRGTLTNVSNLAVILTVGFASWGINILNI